MGKLSDRLKEISQAGIRPIGFTVTATRSPSPSLLVVAMLEAPDTEAVSQAVQANADAVLVPVGPATEDAVLKALNTAAKHVLWGGILETGGKEELERLQKAGGAFALLRSGALGADSLSLEEVDTILEVDPNWSDILVRAIDQVPVAAVVFRVLASEALTIHQLLLCQRVVGLTRKPTFVTLPPTVGREALQPLRDAGVRGIIVAAAAVPDLRAAIRALPEPKKPKERVEALLPLVSEAPRREEHEEEP